MNDPTGPQMERSKGAVALELEEMQAGLERLGKVVDQVVSLFAVACREKGVCASESSPQHDTDAQCPLASSLHQGNCQIGEIIQRLKRLGDSCDL